VNTVKRLTAIVASLAGALLTLAVCCTAAPLVVEQHGCCKGRCASISTGDPLLVLTLSLPAIVFAPGSGGNAGIAATAIAWLRGIQSRLFKPILTIQLRI
jgi:hypothetical protein